jgi:hypothetical protein
MGGADVVASKEAFGPRYLEGVERLICADIHVLPKQTERERRQTSNKLV